MNRAQAADWLASSGFDTGMKMLKRLTDDSASGYGPALDRAFAVYADANDLTIDVNETVVPIASEYGFTLLLEACTLDILCRGFAAMVDVNVDAPLMGMKISQAYRQYESMRDRAWKTAAEYGYIQGTTVGGFKINLDFIEPRYGPL